MSKHKSYKIITIICKECKKAFGARTRNAKHCPECHFKIQQQRLREYRQQQKVVRKQKESTNYDLRSTN